MTLTPPSAPLQVASRSHQRGPFGLFRDPDAGPIGGVAEGIGHRLGLDPWLVRLVFIVLTTVGGLGPIVYAIAMLSLPEQRCDEQPTTPRRSAQYAVAATVVVSGLLLILRGSALWLSDELTLAMSLAAVSSGLVWVQASDDERSVWRSALQRAVGEGDVGHLTSLGRLRLALAATLLVSGIAMMVFLLVGQQSGVVAIGAAVLVTMFGVALVAVPVFDRLTGQIDKERRERIRSEERAEMAAHLHDSVLQTLALIQRTNDPAQARRLARSQERELRSWLFGRTPGEAPTRLGAALEALAGRVEERHGVEIEVVLVSDLTLDDDLRAVVAATGEAMVNAAKHSGADVVSVFIRDEGSGFDPQTIGSDRRGIRDSIQDRVQRHGGRVELWSEPGAGTEIEIVMPRTKEGNDDE